MVTRAEIVAEARLWLGTPYHHQGSVLGVGCDCVGLVRGVYRGLIGPEPEDRPNYSMDWGEVNGAETMLEYFFKYLSAIPCFDNPLTGVMTVRRRIANTPGVVLAMRWKPGLVAKHCIVTIGNGQAIQAVNNNVVSEFELSDWWLSRCAAAFDFPGVV